MWVGLLVLGVAFTLRFYINRGQTWGTPDEKAYSIYAKSWRIGESYRKQVNGFLSKPDLEIPPTRYGFFAVCALIVGALRSNGCYQVVTWVAAVSGALASWVAYQVTHDWKSSLLVASSALSLILSRRALQDTYTALLVLLGVCAVAIENVWLLGGSVFLAVASREALLLYLPALLVAWVLKTNQWVAGPSALGLGVTLAVLAFYAIGGRKLLEIFHKLKQSTDYVRRLQSGMPHRVLVDLTLVSPVTTLGALLACTQAPLWLVSFAGFALITHAFTTPKNVRFMLAIDLTARMLCAWLPEPLAWGILGAGLVADLYLYRVFKDCRDPVTYNLVVQTNMYREKESHG
jgi:hypothetical protein